MTAHQPLHTRLASAAAHLPHALLQRVLQQRRPRPRPLAHDTRALLDAVAAADSRALNRALCAPRADDQPHPFVLAALLHCAGAGAGARDALLEVLAARLHELDTRSRAALVCALRTAGAAQSRTGLPGLPPSYTRAICGVFLGTQGSAELSLLKDSINCAGPEADLWQVVYRDIGSLPQRYSILQHFAAVAAAGRAADPASPRPVQLVSDFDDTLIAMWLDARFPRGTVYPGVAAFVSELHGTSAVMASEAEAAQRARPLLMQPLLPGWWHCMLRPTATAAAAGSDGTLLVRIDDVDNAGLLRGGGVAGAPDGDDAGGLPRSVGAPAGGASGSVPDSARDLPGESAQQAAQLVQAGRGAVPGSAGAPRDGGAGGGASGGAPRLRELVWQRWTRLLGGASAAQYQAPTLPTGGDDAAAASSSSSLTPLPSSLVVLTARPADVRGIIKQRTLLSLQKLGLGLQLDRVPLPALGHNVSGAPSGAARQAGGDDDAGLGARHQPPHAHDSATQDGGAAAAGARPPPRHAIVLLGSLLRSTSTAAIAHNKLENLLAYRALWPESAFVLLGDSGQGDAAVAAAALSSAPLAGAAAAGAAAAGAAAVNSGAPPRAAPAPVELAPVVAAFIHDVQPGEARTGDGQLKSELVARGVGRLVLFQSYAGAAAAAARLRLLSPEAAARVVDATHAGLQRVEWSAHAGAAARRSAAHEAAQLLR